MLVDALTPLQARVLLVLSLEPQSVAQVAHRLSKQGHMVELSGVRFLLNSLTRAELAVLDQDHSHVKFHYRLASGTAVERALDRAYEMMTRFRAQ